MNRREVLRGGIIGGLASAIPAIAFGQNSEEIPAQITVDPDLPSVLKVPCHPEPNDSWILLPNQIHDVKSLVEAYPQALAHLLNPDYEVQKIAVSICGEMIEYVPVQTEELQLLAIKSGEDWADYDMLVNPSYAVQLATVTRFGLMIAKIPNPSEELQLAALTTDMYGNAFISCRASFEGCSENVLRRALGLDYQCIKHIDDPSPEFQLLAVTANANAICMIKTPCEEAFDYVLDKNPRVLDGLKEGVKVPFSIQDKLAAKGHSGILTAMDRNGIELSLPAQLFLLNHSYSYQQKFLQNKKNKLDELSLDVQKAIIKLNCHYLSWSLNPSEELQLFAFNQYGASKTLNSLHDNVEPCEALQIAIVTKRSADIRRIKKPSPKLEKIMMDKYINKLANTFKKDSAA